MKSFRQYVNEAARYHDKDEDDSEVLHHVTPHDFVDFKPFSHFGTKNAARARATDLNSHKPEFTHFNTYSVRIKKGNVANISDIHAGGHKSIHILNALHHAGHITDAEHKDTMNKFFENVWSEDSDHAPILRDLLKKKNIDTLSYTNFAEDPGKKSYIITDPKQVKVLHKSKVKSSLNYQRGEKYLGTDNENYDFVNHIGTLLAMKKPNVIKEMAKPRTLDHSKVYYHGTGEREAQEILKTGMLKGREKQERYALAPMKDHVYITPHLSYAQIYGIGGDMAGHENAHKYAKGEHAYIFEVSGKDLKDISPDEDSVGEKAADEVRTKWNAKTRKWESDAANKHHALGHMARRYATLKQLDNLKSGFIDAQAMVGKKLNKLMSDDMKYSLIDDGSHIAHNGPLPVSRAWRVHKSKFHLLKRDGSNFFDHAEEVPLKNNKTVEESLEKIIDRIRNDPYEKSKYRTSGFTIFHNTKIGDHDVNVWFRRRLPAFKKKSYEVNFMVNDEENSSRSGVTDPKDGIEIARHVRDTVKGFVKHFDPDELHFEPYDSNLGKMIKKEKVYTSGMRRISREIGGKLISSKGPKIGWMKEENLDQFLNGILLTEDNEWSYQGWHGTPDKRGILKDGFKTLAIRHGQDDPKQIYFASIDRKVAASYADDRRAFDYQNAEPATLPVELRMKNPKVINWEGRKFHDKDASGNWHHIDDHIEQARQEGHDGVIIHRIIDNYDAKGRPSTIMAVFDHRNIRVKK